ncbi:MAG: RdgB/HAM1 family non-canonical purine NTP pyrophosphatase [Kiritimatiellaeota bacterium]|nr:RdgB/HAM1 family non-canonical purine NTP pyrophosphatase [Kiritimatiellota bacterium]
MPKRVLFATGNPHKLCEVRAILAPAGIAVAGARDVGGLPEVDETGETFRENAVAKAVSGCRATGLPTLADDSGLVVHALNGRPGVRSARYAGIDATDRRNLEKLLDEMRTVDDRRAKFVCVMALALPDGRVETMEGEVRGTLRRAPCGSNGFGYDPIFQPEGRTHSFAELSETEKNRISHRADALRKALRSGLFACVPDTPEQC